MKLNKEQAKQGKLITLSNKKGYQIMVLISDDIHGYDVSCENFLRRKNKKSKKLLKADVGEQINVSFLEYNYWSIKQKQEICGYIPPFKKVLLPILITCINNADEKTASLEKLYDIYGKYMISLDEFWTEKSFDEKIKIDTIKICWKNQYNGPYPDVFPYSDLLKIFHINNRRVGKKFINNWSELSTQIKKFIIKSAFEGKISYQNLIELEDFWSCKSIENKQKLRMLNSLKDENYDFREQLPNIFPYYDITNLLDKKKPKRIIKKWNQLSQKVKNYIFNLSIKGEVNLYDFDFIIEKEKKLDNILILYLLKHKNKSNLSHFLWQFMEHIKNFLWENTKPIDIRPFLPICKKGNFMYCEGIKWEKENKYWCRGFACNAKYFDERNYDFDFFSKKPLIEILEELSFREKHPINKILEKTLGNFASKHDFVSKIGGWLNRVNRIRERLECNECGEFMKPDLDYSKPENKARYRVTLFYCDNKKCIEYGEKYYLNTCWACSGFIDSRESSIKVEDRYLCIECGSGNQEPENYTQGDMCPNCGFKKMKNTSKKNYVCQKCKHRIEIPVNSNIKGPRAEERRINN